MKFIEERKKKAGWSKQDQIKNSHLQLRHSKHLAFPLSFFKNTIHSPSRKNTQPPCSFSFFSNYIKTRHCPSWTKDTQLQTLRKFFQESFPHELYANLCQSTYSLISLWEISEDIKLHDQFRNSENIFTNMKTKDVGLYFQITLCHRGLNTLWYQNKSQTWNPLSQRKCQKILGQPKQKNFQDAVTKVKYLILTINTFLWLHTFKMEYMRK